MSLGLNVVVGMAGLLDLGYVAFYALGAYSMGWFGSEVFSKLNIHILVSPVPRHLPGVHLNFVLILIASVIVCAVAGMIIGLPTLRLRGDYIAIVTLAFGEIIGVVAVNGQSISLGHGMTLTAGNLGIPSVDAPYFPGLGARRASCHPAGPRLAAGPRVDRAARGRGRRGVDGHTAGAHQAARVRDGRG